jgi:hypothetical protein
VVWTVLALMLLVRPLNVFAATVLIQGLSSGLVAELFAVRRPSNAGYVLLGASALGLAMGRLLRQNDQEILFLDSNADACKDEVNLMFADKARVELKVPGVWVALRRGTRVLPVDETLELKKNNSWMLAVSEQHRPEAEDWLQNKGCTPLPDDL